MSGECEEDVAPELDPPAHEDPSPLPAHRVALRMLCQGAVAALTVVPIAVAVGRWEGASASFVAAAAAALGLGVALYGAIYTCGEEVARRLRPTLRLAGVAAVVGVAPLLAVGGVVWAQAIVAGRGPVGAFQVLAKGAQELVSGAGETLALLGVWAIPPLVLAGLRLDALPLLRRGRPWPLRDQLIVAPAALVATVLALLLARDGVNEHDPTWQVLLAILLIYGGVGAGFVLGLHLGRRLERRLLARWARRPA